MASVTYTTQLLNSVLMLVNLLMRFYDIDSGHIFIDGQNIQDISRKNLRRNVAIVLQDTVLFSDTILANLKYGRESASKEEVEQAVSMSRCGDLLQSRRGAGTPFSPGQARASARDSVSRCAIVESPLSQSIVNSRICLIDIPARLRDAMINNLSKSDSLNIRFPF